MQPAPRRVSTHDGLSLAYFAYDEGSRESTPVLCLHGLTRNSRDFHDLAGRLSATRPVYALDFRGRGASERDPSWQNYTPAVYVRDVQGLLDHLGLSRVAIVGTSLGGLVAMGLARDDAERLAGVLLNDIGPEITSEGLERVRAYTGKLPPVDDHAAALAQVQAVYGPSLPDLGAEDWEKMVWRGYRTREDGRPELDMDPAIGTAVRELGAELVDPWGAFDALRPIPTTVLHGVRSDLLSEAIIDKMKARKPDLVTVDVPDRGHVPLLDEPVSLAAIDAWLERLR